MNDNPHEWTEEQIDEAFKHFTDYYHPGGVYERTFAGQSPVTREEYTLAAIEDFDATKRGEVVHPTFKRGREALGFLSLDEWGWSASDTIERESIRDRIRMARGQDPIGFF